MICRSVWVLGLRLRDFCRYDNGWAEDYWLGARMGVYAEGNHKIEEHSGRIAWATVQLRGLHDALHVLFLEVSTINLCILSVSTLVMIGCCLLNFVCSTIYNMCTQKPPHDYSQQLYDKYRESFEEYISSMVRNKLIWDIHYGLIHIAYQQLENIVVNLGYLLLLWWT